MPSQLFTASTAASAISVQKTFKDAGVSNVPSTGIIGITFEMNTSSLEADYQQKQVVQWITCPLPTAAVGDTPTTSNSLFVPDLLSDEGTLSGQYAITKLAFDASEDIWEFTRQNGETLAIISDENYDVPYAGHITLRIANNGNIHYVNSGTGINGGVRSMSYGSYGGSSVYVVIGVPPGGVVERVMDGSNDLTSAFTFIDNQIVWWDGRPHWRWHAAANQSLSSGTLDLTVSWPKNEPYTPRHALLAVTSNNRLLVARPPVSELVWGKLAMWKQVDTTGNTIVDEFTGQKIFDNIITKGYQWAVDNSTISAPTASIPQYIRLELDT